MNSEYGRPLSIKGTLLDGTTTLWRQGHVYRVGDEVNLPKWERRWWEWLLRRPARRVDVLHHCVAVSTEGAGRFKEVGCGR